MDKYYIWNTESKKDVELVQIVRILVEGVYQRLVLYNHLYSVHIRIKQQRKDDHAYESMEE